jgi:hypothetical protein
MRKQVRLRMVIDTRMWGLSASPEEGDGIDAPPVPEAGHHGVRRPAAA